MKQPLITVVVPLYGVANIMGATSHTFSHPF